MPRWEVRAKDRTVQVEADNWLIALGFAVVELGLDADAMTRMVCDAREDGSLRVREPLSGMILGLHRVRTVVARAREAWNDQVEDIFDLDAQLDESVAPTTGAARFALADAAEEASGPDPTDLPIDEDDDFFDGWGERTGDTPPPLAMPFPRVDDDMDGVDPFFDDEQDVSRSSYLPPSVQITLLERGLEIAGARSPESAADLALTVLRQVIPSEAGSVLIHSRGMLLFLAAQGPRAERLHGATMPANIGIAGFVAGRGESLMVNNTSGDIRHDPHWDGMTGYRTKSVLAVPLRDARDEVRGCMELLNPPSRFLPWHLEAAQSVAVALAEALRALTG